MRVERCASHADQTYVIGNGSSHFVSGKNFSFFPRDVFVCDTFEFQLESVVTKHLATNEVKPREFLQTEAPKDLSNLTNSYIQRRVISTSERGEIDSKKHLKIALQDFENGAHFKRAEVQYLQVRYLEVQ